MKHRISIVLVVETTIEAEELVKQIENNPLSVFRKVEEIHGFLTDEETNEDFPFFALDLLKR